MTRKTFFPLYDDRLGFMVEVSKRELDATTPSHDTHRQEIAIRRIVGALEDAGYTTHLDVVRDSMTVQRAARSDRGYTMRFQFPPSNPRVGEPARLEGGPAHGETVPVPPGDLKVLTQDGGEHLYRPAGFDTATGHWVYEVV